MRRWWPAPRTQLPPLAGGAADLELLAAENVSVRFGATDKREQFMAVSDVSLSLAPGESLGIVGESGAGKTTLARCLAGLRFPTDGIVRYRGTPVNTRGRSVQMPRVRGTQVVFQDPGGSLNPRRSVASLLAEVLRVHRMCPSAEIDARVDSLLQEVGLNPSVGARRPGTLSGGQQQRAAIARALAFEPELLIADEAVSSLDASIQAQILNLLANLRSSRGVAILMISHDTAVIRQLCDRVGVMYRGELVETGLTETVFSAPTHEYTRALLDAVPRWDPQPDDGEHAVSR